MPHHVTVGLDGSPESAAAAEWAAREALLRGVPLRLVHADEWPTSAAIPVAGPDAQRRWADELLAATAQQLQRGYPSLEISARRLSGRPAAALSIEAAEADLLVLGSRGLSGVMGFLLGSVGMETIVATERPVVLVRGTGQPSARTDAAPGGPSGGVVVGVDIHQSCDLLLDFAFDEAARRGGRLRAVYGWSIPPVVRDASALEAAERAMSQDVARRLTDILMPWRQKFPSVEVVERSPIGGPSHQLVREAAGAELVVVGRSIRRSPLGAHIGSVTHAVIHHCSSPVAVVAHD
ncbi:universal stress protein [Streptomyces sp. NPDC018833]|uniref:universal stress protein n=1 Tax=Streptomyces sp. NPDC018833 TaxID=3365053 RepID=UPI0037AFF1E9